MAKPMAGKIHRRKKSSDFVTLDTHCSRNKNLRWAPKGLHTYLFQLPDDWQINIADLENRSEDGRDSTTSAMNALISAGYVVRERKHNDKGRFEGYDYFVFERPEHAVEWLTVNGKPVNGLTVNGKTATNKGLSYSKKNNNKNEGRGNEQKQTPTPPTIFSGFREVYDYLEENNPGIFDEPYAPTHAITTVEKTAVPGTITKIVEGINLEPTNPNATTALFNRMNLTPQATNGDEADAILTKWAADNIETVKLKYNRAKRKFTPEDLDRLIVKFCGQYASNKDTGTRERFLYDPARFFNDKLSAWLADQPGFEKMLDPKNGFHQPVKTEKSEFTLRSNMPKNIRRF